MVLRQRAVHHHGDDDRHGAVEQLELARPQSSGLQLQSELGGSQTSAPNTFGATISVSTSVASGQGYYIKVTAAGGPGPIGGYGLLVNFGSQTQSPIPPPNTVVAATTGSGRRH